MKYLHWDQKTLPADSYMSDIGEMYEKGYVFTRLGKGVMQQTRSVRIDLSKFSPSSENRRILKKTSEMNLSEAVLPFTDYNFNIGKMAKDFYATKFGEGIMSAHKIKEMLTDSSKSNFNLLLCYDNGAGKNVFSEDTGYSICFKTPSILHYSYPFYDLQNSAKDTGLGMMIRAIEHIKQSGLKYIYLGSLQRPSDTYKLQFEGLEWFDGKQWQTDIEAVKKILASAKLPKRVHVVGICGVATSALAIAFHEKGVHVTGSDKGFFPPVSTELEKHGIPFYAGWHPEKMFSKDDNEAIRKTGSTLTDENIVIVGTASGTHNSETTFAKESGISRYSYPEVIGKYFVKENSVVCAGTWGKTSSSSLLSFILEQADFDPTYMFGGISLSHKSSAHIGDSKWSVFEGDEYKSSPTDPRAKFFHYKPTHLLLSAVSWDHADLYPTEETYFNTFWKLIETIPANGLVVACSDQPGTSSVISSYKGKLVTYGRAGIIKKDLSDENSYTYKNALQTKDGLDLTIVHQGKEFAVHSPMLGLYQAENICGCFAMAHQIGIDANKIIAAISTFKGLKRRMEKRLDGSVSNKGITIIDDIAHSPDKARSVLNTLRNIYGGKIIAVFEPNSGARRREIIAKYDGAFDDANIVIIPRLTKLKIAENETEQSIEGAELAQIFSKTHSNVQYIEDDSKLVEFLISNTKKDDVVAFIGSHGFRGMIEEVCTLLK